MTAPLRVLLIEDEALILMQLEALVEDAGHAVVGTAMRRDEAVDLAHALRPDLALVDLALCDGGSGLDVALALREAAGTMVVFVTANPLKLGDDLSGAAGVIAKPFSRSVVAGGMRYIEECLRRPPPAGLPPQGMRMAARYAARRPAAPAASAPRR